MPNQLLDLNDWNEGREGRDGKRRGDIMCYFTETRISFLSNLPSVIVPLELDGN